MSKPDTVENSNELLLATFQIGDAFYGLDTTLVLEVSQVQENTFVHHAPDYVHGIINLRGNIVTVIDLGKKLESGDAQISAESRILIVPWLGEQVGLLVDYVGDVLSLQTEQIKPTPANVPDTQRHYIEGAYENEEQLVGILNLDTLLVI